MKKTFKGFTKYKMPYEFFEMNYVTKVGNDLIYPYSINELDNCWMHVYKNEEDFYHPNQGKMTNLYSVTVTVETKLVKKRKGLVKSWSNVMDEGLLISEKKYLEGRGEGTTEIKRKKK